MSGKGIVSPEKESGRGQGLLALLESYALEARKEGFAYCFRWWLIVGIAVTVLAVTAVFYYGQLGPIFRLPGSQHHRTNGQK
jgi:hypothetical protein